MVKKMASRVRAMSAQFGLHCHLAFRPTLTPLLPILGWLVLDLLVVLARAFTVRADQAEQKRAWRDGLLHSLSPF
ncbi:MAG: hypothetical protein CM15mP89_2380 [Gammaproteobacteria bacterium]|nr:MAG: hypothetical protein CM15mP89_2380 [Gammaproteobacteria bacterium]